MDKIVAGTENERDCLVSVEPSKDLEIVIQAKVERVYDEQIENLARKCLENYGVEKAKVTINEKGALDYVIKARLDFALSLFTGKTIKEKGIKRKVTPKDRARRSRLYVPGNNPRLLINAGVFGSDCIILDLEDSVSLEQKGAARYLVKEALKTLDFGNSEIWVRVNKEFLEDDLRQVMIGAPHGICLPKSECREDIERAVELIERYEDIYDVKETKLMPIIESAKGIVNLEEVASSSDRIVALAFGAEDFTRDIGGEKSWDKLLFARSRIVVVAKAFGIQALDTVYSDVEDVEGLIEETKRIVKMGFDGKGAIHPEQIGYIHSCFTPTQDEIEYAKRIIEALEDAKRKGSGVVSLDGKMIDKPIVKRAERILKLGGIL